MDSRIVDAILSHHGQTLIKLNISPFETRTIAASSRNQQAVPIPMEFTKDYFTQIQAQCPALEELAIPVQSDMSSTSEAEMYTCFSKMRSFRSLFLLLDCLNRRLCADSTYVNPRFDREDDQKSVDGYGPWRTRGHMKERFINCAVDEALARSIWKTITQNKMGRQLERLRLWTTSSGHESCFYIFSWDPILKDLSRSWLIERALQDDQDEIIVRELRQRRRELDDADVREGYESVEGQVFREIWPSKGSRGW